MQIGSKKKVLIALSGGIDSAVSAWLLLKQGFEVEAAFMKNWSSTAGLLKNECPWLQDRQDALRVAAFLKIPLHTLDFEKQYQKNVMGYFFKEYAKGRTPNPDVMCNKEIKFKLLYNWAMKNGFDFLATGHYAQIVKSPKSKVKSKELGKENFKLSTFNFQLTRSADEFKDQTYFIYNIKTEQLPHVFFPIGHLKKTQVKAMALKIGLPNAQKKESMGLCFVGRIRLKDFLEQKLKPKIGSILDQDGKVLGKHKGLHNFTIGQRQGINVGAKGPYFVFKKDLKTNVLFVTNNPEDERLLTKEVDVHSVNWISNIGVREEGRGLNISINHQINKTSHSLLARFRHQGKLVPVILRKVGKDLYNVKFKTPQKALASGQSLVFYFGKECLGGGVIA